MPLSDPELDMLQEFLEDDPGDEAFVEVAQALVLRQRHGEALEVLQAGLQEDASRDDGWRLLVEASFTAGRFLVCLEALDRVTIAPGDPDQSHLARARVVALEKCGKVREAAAAAEAYLEHFPDDYEIQGYRDRLSSWEDAPATEQVSLRGRDPFDTLERAEAYAMRGWKDRAARIFRRILMTNPDHPLIRRRLAELAHAPEAELPDDLSEELPPLSDDVVIELPQSNLHALIADDEVTEPHEQLDLSDALDLDRSVDPGIGAAIGELVLEFEDDLPADEGLEWSLADEDDLPADEGLEWSLADEDDGHGLVDLGSDDLAHDAAQGGWDGSSDADELEALEALEALEYDEEHEPLPLLEGVELELVEVPEEFLDDAPDHELELELSDGPPSGRVEAPPSGRGPAADFFSDAEHDEAFELSGETPPPAVPRHGRSSPRGDEIDLTELFAEDEPSPMPAARRQAGALGRARVVEAAPTPEDLRRQEARQRAAAELRRRQEVKARAVEEARRRQAARRGGGPTRGGDGDLDLSDPDDALSGWGGPDQETEIVAADPRAADIRRVQLGAASPSRPIQEELIELDDGDGFVTPPGAPRRRRSLLGRRR
ncbi:MAG: hypothetical protein JXX28_03020 [Deltaproteobacteria bacterium]|nr:hypothetical protein [Deltaproteobacteria bacterium]